jgi:hypothetical protein
MTKEDLNRIFDELKPKSTQSHSLTSKKRRAFFVAATGLKNPDRKSALSLSHI